MPPRLKVETGDKYNRLTIIKEVEMRKGRRQFLCKCDCGNEGIYRLTSIRSGAIKSCGCFKKEVGIRTLKKLATKRPNYSEHDSYYKEMYGNWHDMKQRCLNKNSKAFKHYGGRGIKIYDEWLKFAPFREWAISNGWKEGLTLERINVNSNYELSNCCWISQRDQLLNTRRTVYLTIDSETKPLMQWAKEYNIKPHIIRSRLADGWDSKPAVTVPKGGARYGN